MRIASFVPPGLLVAASIFGLACSTPETPSPQNPPQAGFENPEQTSMRAPVRLSLEQGAKNAATGETDVLVHIDVAEPIAYPVSINATPAGGSALAAGAPSETVMLNQPGRLTRVFRVAGPNALSLAAPFRVVVQGRTADNSMGFYAKKQFPPEPEMTPPPRSRGVPGGRPPGMAPPR
ncbi:MAG: hypothetical protein MUF34_18065 [Polyangiaceae bacterium]|jgi:hypothetical protein|nr:hypothetical protein [Polyangiaceae bacterium]